MHVAEIWRYPVKTMAGERLERARFGTLGIEGDRVVHVEDREGRVITSRTHPGFLGHKGILGSDGEPLVDGRPWKSASVAADVARIAGRGSKLVRFEGAERFDVLPLLVATDGAIAAFGHDRRRLRPNLVIGGVEGLAEREWPGRCLRIGKVLIGVQDLRLRCIMTSFDPDTLEQDASITRDIYRRFEGKVALNGFVIEAGEIAVGDPVAVARGRACAEPADPRAMTPADVENPEP
ncbi:MAG: MOSC domain-containing protein [Thermoanaerobaculia bacterium]